MKILQVNKFYYPWIGGIETVVKDLSEKIVDAETEVTVLCCNNKNFSVENMINNVRVIRAASYKVFLGMPISISFFNYFRSIVTNFDIIHFHFPFPLAIIAILLFRPSKKIVITWHSDIVRQKIFNFILDPLVNIILSRADAIIVGAKPCYKTSYKLKKFREKIRIIPFGIPIDYYSSDDIKNALLFKKKYLSKQLTILFVGRLVYYKGVEYLIKGFAIARKKISNCTLVIVGEGYLAETLHKLCKDLKIEARVQFQSHMSEKKLKKYFLSSDIFVLPSIYKSEAFGLVQLQAMLAKKPIINTLLFTGVNQVSVDKETGITVKPQDAAAIAEAIVTLANNKILSQEYGNNGFKRVAECFSLKKMVSNYRKCYKQILSQ